MELKIDLKNIIKITGDNIKITTENNGRQLEYIIEDGKITDVIVLDEKEIVKRKINNFADQDGQIKRIKELINRDKEIDEIVKKHQKEVANTVIPDFTDNEEENKKLHTIENINSLSTENKRKKKKAKNAFEKCRMDDASTIVELDRNGSLDTAMKIQDHTARIVYLKEMIKKLKKDD